MESGRQELWRDAARPARAARTMRPYRAPGGAWSVFFSVMAALVLCLLASGCSGNDVEPATPGELQALQKAAAASPVLAAGETINVIVYGESSLTGKYLIDPSGYVSLPLAGTIKASGLTPEQLARDLEKKFGSKYLANPKITVEVAEFRPFYILGEVEKPGVYPYNGGLTVLNAVAIAGGTTYRAKTSKVLIQHLGENQFHEFEFSGAVPILPGDIIQVPRRYF